MLGLGGEGGDAIKVVILQMSAPQSWMG